MMPDKPTSENPDEPVRDEPEVVPAISAEQPGVGAAIGVEAFGKRAGADEGMDNDEESHVAPPDNDGETVPS